MSGHHPIKHWSLTHTTIELSSGEAKFSGICRGASPAFGLQSIANNLGISFKVAIFTNATAAVGVAEAGGFGKFSGIYHQSVVQVTLLLRQNYLIAI